MAPNGFAVPVTGSSLEISISGAMLGLVDGF